MTFNELLEHDETRDLPAILLVDPADKVMMKRAKADSRHRILVGLPVSVKKLRAALVKLRRIQEEASQ